MVGNLLIVMKLRLLFLVAVIYKIVGSKRRVYACASVCASVCVPRFFGLYLGNYLSDFQNFFFKLLRNLYSKTLPGQIGKVGIFDFRYMSIFFLEIRCHTFEELIGVWIFKFGQLEPKIFYFAYFFFFIALVMLWDTCVLLGAVESHWSVKVITDVTCCIIPDHACPTRGISGQIPLIEDLLNLLLLIEERQIVKK